MSGFILPEPPEELKQHSNALCEKIHLEINSIGLIPFSQYMEMALYEPGLGYYSAGLHKFGSGGDFVTSPELGSLFAACLASQITEIADKLVYGNASYDILELGAGSGKLAADLLNELPEGLRPRRYMILERSADLRAVQQRTIAENVPDWQNRVKWLSQPPGDAWDGILLANEVIDALSVERFRIGNTGVEQACVGFAEQSFAWRFRAAPAELEQAVRCLELNREAEYTSEINLHLTAWLNSVSTSLRKGIALFVDYGYPRKDFYRPDRSDGTLICHYRHRVHEDVFFYPGLQDITSFVDFTALAEAAEACSFDVSGYTSQTMFLLGCGLDHILTRQVRNGDGDSEKLTSQARQLTLPTHMGERFQVMALSRNLELDLRGFGLRDLSHRL
jgi:SAM-dependent MidA family methyltransferase